MTDLEKFIELYKSVGIELKEEKDTFVGDGKTEEVLFLELNEREQEKVTGYGGFVTLIVFDLQGKFLRQEIWE